MPNTLTLAQITSLKIAHKKAKDKRSADRIKAVYLWSSGDSLSEIARVLLLDETTLRRYVERFKEAGIDGLLECHYAGGVSDLTLTQTKEIEEYLDLHTMPTAQAAISYIKKKYKVTYSTTGVTKLLHRLGFSYKKPKVIPGKTNPEKQDQFIEEYHTIERSLGKNDTIHFLDASHPTHNTTASYGWIKKGRDGDKFIKTNTGRERLNLHGALNFKTKTAIVLSEKTIDADSVIKLLNRLIKQYPHGKIHLILDNATYYHSNLVKEWKRHHTRVKLHFLPSYSPNLNLIERLWHFYHKIVTSSRYFPTFEEFKYRSLYFFRHLDRYQKELTSLITDNFQTYPAAAVLTSATKKVQIGTFD